MVLLRTFGGLSLDCGGTLLPASATQRRRLSLLVLLASAGDRGISRERLLAYLWPENSTENARHALDQLLYATRRDLGRDAVLSEGGQLRLNPQVVRSDRAEFDSCIECGHWEKAIALYAGPFLDGVHLSDSAELERWMEAERQKLEGRFLAALERLAGEARERGDAEAAVAWWRRRAAADPLNARAALGLLRALVESGNRAGAIQHARTYAVLVREELEADPDPEVLAFAEQLARDRAPGGSAQSTHRLPAIPAAAIPQEAPRAGGSGSPLAGSEPGGRPGDRAFPRRNRAALIGAAVVALGLGGVFWIRPQDAPAAHEFGVASVAVLPFQDLSEDGSAEYLGDGMSEELIHALAQVPDLRVAARTSAFAFKGRQEDIREIARALGVSAVVEGSVRREGDRLRITAQLIDAANGYHLWSGSFDQRMGDALAIQGAIARSLAHTLRPQLTGRGSHASSSIPPNSRAYHLYLRGRYAWNQRTDSSLRKAVQLFEQAIVEEPSYAAAYAGLADAHDALADGGFAPAEPSYERAEAAARRAIQLDSSLAEAFAALGHLKFHRWDWAGAEGEFRRALELSPGHAGAYSHYAMSLVMRGRFDEGLALMRKAQELDPLALGAHNRMGWLLFLAGRHGEAIDQLRAVIAMDSTRAYAHARLGLSLVESGRFEEGITSLERAVDLGGGYYRSALPMLGYAYAKAGRRGDAERIRARVERELMGGPINPYYAAALMAALSRKDRAFSLLDHAYQTNKGCLIDLGVDPMMDALRPDPRYAALAQALGMEANGGEF
jgi:TolB-like protein/DNA-binding SARP family transcriptional activator/Flp pilus assembly protein TadD